MLDVFLMKVEPHGFAECFVAVGAFLVYIIAAAAIVLGLAIMIRFILDWFERKNCREKSEQFDSYYCMENTWYKKKISPDSEHIDLGELYVYEIEEKEGEINDGECSKKIHV